MERPHRHLRARHRHERQPSHDRTAGLVMLGTILFCTMLGIGIGVFYIEPNIGGLIGAFLGIVIGVWVVPNLLTEVD
jgi:hypothetical protein